MTAEERAQLAVQAETRTSDQQRHDVVASIIATAARSAEQPTIGGAAPTVLVSVRASDLESGRGAAHADGVPIPVSLRAARHLMCTGGIQTVVIDDDGAIVQLGSPERCFTAHQRRAILLRDGGCLIPGCSVPASWCEIHHVVPDVDGGPTHPDNGVMLCWFHHRTIDTSGWGIRMIRGAPQIRPPAWLDPGGGWRPATNSPTRVADRLETEQGAGSSGRGAGDPGDEGDLARGDPAEQGGIRGESAA
jgi:5-methylcytosine-specific restriction protein A